MRIKQKILYISLIIGSVLILFFGMAWKRFLETPLSDKAIIFDVPPGSSIKSVAGMLHNKGILPNKEFFILLASFKGALKHLKAGEYQIDPGITAHQLLTKLIAGKVILRQLTIVEGWTLKQVLKAAQVNPYLAHSCDESNIPQLAQKIGDLRLEGNLYPDTYLFAKGVKDYVILRQAFRNMQKKLATVWQKRFNTVPYSDPYQALIVASLIEKETARPEERAKIAGVILRRLQKGMLLQIDASVIYGLGDKYKGKLSREDLKINTPYNTYLRKGLPPTPIAMPSIASITAALQPESGTELYYVARGDGTHEFSNTLEEHHKAIHRYHVQYLEKLELSQLIPTDQISKWLSKTKTYTSFQVVRIGKILSKQHDRIKKSLRELHEK